MSTLPSCETNTETHNGGLPNGSTTQDSPVAIVSHSNGIEGGKTKQVIKKPRPPVQAKPSRFLKTKSLTFSTLPRLGHKGSKTKGANGESHEENGVDAGSNPPGHQGSKGQQRESPLWKIPGISTLKKNRRHSSAIEEVNFEESVQPRMSTTPPEKHKSITVPPHQSRELPPLPTLPPLGVALPSSNIQEVDQNGSHTDTAQTTNDSMSHFGSLTAPNAAAATAADNSLFQNKAQSDISSSQSLDSLTQQMASAPQSSSTPKIDHSSTSNGQIEKADTIHSLIEKYNRHVPLRIRVLQGYCSDTADVNISTGDLYDVQRVKATKVVTIRDQDGMTYRVPLESTMKFGLVFNLSSNYDEGLCGYTFRTVSDLTSLAVLPRVVCTLKAFEGNDARSSVQENEILVIKQALKSLFRGKRGIKVYSLLMKTEKVLPEDCDVGFSTNPSLVRLHLSDFIEYISNPFPAHAVMYPSTDNTDEDVPGTLSRVITMLDYSTEQFLIVSAVIGEDDDTSTDESTFFEIPLDDDMMEIELSVLKWTTPPESPEVLPSREGDSIGADQSSYDDEDDHVYDDTVNILQSSDALRTLAENRRCSWDNNSAQFSPDVHSEKTPPLPDKPDWLSQHPQPVQSAHATKSVASKYDNIAPSLPERRMVPIPQASEEEDPGYDTVGTHLLRRGDSNSYSKLQQDRCDGSDGGDPRILSWMEDLQSTTNTIESRLVSLERSQRQKAELAEMRRIQSVLEEVTQKIESLESQLNSLAVSTTTPPTTNQEQLAQSGEEKSEEENNKSYLKSLNITKMCELIEVMGLGQYRNKFMSEHVSGEILLECDDQVLQDELGIQSKIHRIRLAKVISGIYSAKLILEQKQE